MNSFDEGPRKRARQDHGFLRIFTQPGLREVRFRILKEQTLAGLWAVRCVAPGVLIEKEVIDKMEPYRPWNRYPATLCLRALCEDRCQLESPALFADLLARFTSYLSTIPNDSTENGWKHVKASLVGGLAVCAACPLAIQTITHTHIPGDGDTLEIIRSRVQTKVQEDLNSYGLDAENCGCLAHDKLPWMWDMLNIRENDALRVQMQRRLVRCAPLSYVYWWRARIIRERITMQEMYEEALLGRRPKTLVALWGDMVRSEQASIASPWAWGKFFEGDSIFYDVHGGDVETLIQHMVRTHGLPHRRTWLHCLRRELVEPDEDLNDEPSKTRAIFLRHVMPLYDRTNRKHAAQIRFVIASALEGDEWTDMFFRWAADYRDVLVAATPEWLADLPPTAREVWRRNIGE